MKPVIHKLYSDSLWTSLSKQNKLIFSLMKEAYLKRILKIPAFALMARQAHLN
jgi:hypothetical protein